MLGAGAWGWPTEMLWGGRWEGGSCLGTHVRIKDFKIKKIKKKIIINKNGFEVAQASKTGILSWKETDRPAVRASENPGPGHIPRPPVCQATQLPSGSLLLGPRTSSCQAGMRNHARIQVRGNG